MNRKIRNILKGERASSTIEVIIWISIILVVAVSIFFFRNAIVKFLTGASNDINGLKPSDWTWGKHPQLICEVTEIGHRDFPRYVYQVNNGGRSLGYFVELGRGIDSSISQNWVFVKNKQVASNLSSKYRDVVTNGPNSIKLTPSEEAEVAFPMNDKQQQLACWTLYENPSKINLLNFVGDYNKINNTTGCGSPYDKNDEWNGSPYKGF